MSIFTGSAVAIITPFNADGSINYDAFKNMVETQIAAGTRAYIDTNYNAHGCEVHDFETRDDMLKCIGHILKTGDNILIKASHGMEFTKVVEALKTINL